MITHAGAVAALTFLGIVSPASGLVVVGLAALALAAALLQAHLLRPRAIPAVPSKSNGPRPPPIF